MKRIIILFFCCCLSFTCIQHTQAQDNRVKIQLSIKYQQKTLETALNSISTSLTRSADDEDLSVNPKDTAKGDKTVHYGNSFYMNMDTKGLSDEMLQLFSKKSTRFSGTITITDTYGKNPDRVIKFSQGYLTALSDQYSGASYSDSYSSTAFSIICKEVSVNGIPLEQ